MNEEILMSPVGVLMVEHRLIERMVDLLEREMEKLGPEKKPDPVFLDGVVEFAATYTDQCHHGKEESILFDRLAMKNLAPEHKSLMDQLVLDHIQSRKIVSNLELQKERFLKGEAAAAGAIAVVCRTLAGFYPGHIEKEEKVFFARSMEYFSKREQDEILKKFWEFDKDLLLAKYLKFFDRYDR